MAYISLSLTILSSFIFLSSFVLYNKNILNSSVKPHIVSWVLFSVITLINAITYVIFTGDVFKSALAFTDFFTCIVITCLILFKGKYVKFTILEYSIIFLSILSLVVWYVLHSAQYANLLLQPAYILAFIPTLKSVFINPENENARVWFMWAFSFILTLVVIFLRWNNNWVDVINPLIAFVLCLSVGLLAMHSFAPSR